MFICECPSCDAPFTKSAHDGYGWQRHECEACHAVCWVENTRLPGMGETWPDAEFREHYAVDDEKRSIKAFSERAKARDAKHDKAAKAAMEWMSTSPWVKAMTDKADRSARNQL